MSRKLSQTNKKKGKFQTLENQSSQPILQPRGLKRREVIPPEQIKKLIKLPNTKETQNNIPQGQKKLYRLRSYQKNKANQSLISSQNQFSQVPRKNQVQKLKFQQKRKRQYNQRQNFEDQTNSQDFHSKDGKQNQQLEGIRKYIQKGDQTGKFISKTKIVQAQKSFENHLSLNVASNQIQLQENQNNPISTQNLIDHKNNEISIIEEKRQTAELSTEIFQLILKKPKDQNFDLMRTSLHDLIMAKINENQIQINENPSSNIKNKNAVKNQSKRKKYHEKVRNKFIELFEQGIKIDQNIFSQARIKAGTFGKEDDKKFVFHPTYFVTSQVFQQLNDIAGNKIVLTGHYGISKTVSVCLFWYLAKFIDEYRFLPGAKLNEGMIKIPKVVYWNITKIKQAKSYELQRFILNQCPQMKKEKLEETESIDSFYKNKGFRVTIVIDQLNQLASVGRENQDTIQTMLSLERKGKSVSQYLTNDQIRFFWKTRTQIKQMRGKIKGTLFLSSMNIQNTFYKQVQMMPESNMKYPTVLQVTYTDKIFDRDSLYQLVDYFLFQLRIRVLRNLNLKKISPKAQYKLKKILFNYLNQEKKKDFFITPCNIRQYLTKFNKSQFEKIKNQTECISKTVETFYECIKKQIDSYSALLRLNFQKNNKDDDNKKLLLMQIYNYLNSCQKYQIKYLKELKQKEPNIIPTKYISIEPQIIDKIIDRKIFNYQKHKNQIQMLLPRPLMIKQLKPFSKTFSSVYIRSINYFLKKLDKGSFQGGIFEVQFILTIINGKISFKLTQTKRQSEEILKFITQFGPNPVYRFKPLQTQSFSKNQNYSYQEQKKASCKKDLKKSFEINLLQRFFGPINKMIEKSQKSAVLLPVLKQFLQKQDQYVDKKETRSNSKIIDVVFIKRGQEMNQKQITIWLFDLTVRIQQIESKIKEFLKNYLKFNDKNVIEHTLQGQVLKFNLKYVVLSLKNQIQSEKLAKKINQQFEGKISFQETKGLNYLNVNQLVGSTQCLLKSVGWMEIGEEFDLDSNEQDIKDEIEIFKKVTQTIIETRVQKTIPMNLIET